jgi:hypothetical protein
MSRLRRFFRDHNETRENHEIGSLQTKYYKTKRELLMEHIVETLNNSNQFHVLNVSQERGEISANIKKPKKGLLVFTIVSIRPFRTAVDISVSFDTMIGIDFGKSEKMIQTLYQDIDKKFEYVGSGLADKL